MSEPLAEPGRFYVAGGTLPPGTPSYVERPADRELYAALLRGELCYVLTARQMGKSSLMARTAKRLQSQGVRTAAIDLSYVGSKKSELTPNHWYFGVADAIYRRLGTAGSLREWWEEHAGVPDAQRLIDFFREVLLPAFPESLVVFVDEIDSTLGLGFTDDFFAALRACHNARATEPIFERLTFTLLGVATPDQLIQDTRRTPFNLGRRIDLTDFSDEEVRPLAAGLHTDSSVAAQRLDRVLHWTSGHPYLTQALCSAVASRAADADVADGADPVDRVVLDVFLSPRARRAETNFTRVRELLVQRGHGRALLRLYRQVRLGQAVSDDPTSPRFALLKLSGVVKVSDSGRLEVRNRIYESIFTAAWARSEMPADWSRRVAAATVAAMLAGLLVWYGIFQPRPYIQALQAATLDGAWDVASGAHQHLRANLLFPKSRADELLAQYWDHQALLEEVKGDRDAALLSWLEAAIIRDTPARRSEARHLVGADYPQLLATFRPGASITTAAFSPDGKTVLTGDSNGNALLWSVDSRRLLRILRYDAATRPSTSPRSPHEAQGTVRPAAEPTAAAFSADSRLVLAAYGFPRLRTQMWEARTGTLVSSYPLEGPEAVATTFHPDATGSWTAAADGTLYDLSLSGRRLGVIKTPMIRTVFSPDGRSALGISKKRVYLADLSLRRVVSSPATDVVRVAFCGDTDTALLLFSDGHIERWDLHTLHRQSSFITTSWLLTAVACSPDGREALTGSLFEARLWDSASGQPLGPRMVNSYPRLDHMVAFGPAGLTLLVTARDEANVRLWRTDIEPSHASGASDFGRVMFSSDGSVLLKGTKSGNVQAYDVHSGKSLFAFSLGERARFLHLSPNGRVIATLAGDNVFRRWDSHSGRLLSELRIPIQMNRRATLEAVGQDASAAVISSVDETYIVNGAALIRLNGVAFFAALSPDQGVAALRTGDGLVLIDSHTGRRLASDRSTLNCVFSPDGKTVIANRDNGEIDLLDAHTLAHLGPSLGSPLRIREPVEEIAFSGDGQRFYVKTPSWLYLYSITHQDFDLLGARWLGLDYGASGFRLSDGDCLHCVATAAVDSSEGLRLQTLDLSRPPDPPIAGDLHRLQADWQDRLGLRFDARMKIVPREGELASPGVEPR